MVYYNLRARSDINQILIGLITWERHQLTYNEICNYIDDIKSQCESLEAKYFHVRASYAIHRKYGDYVHRYKRNQRTCWYIIYDKDLFEDIFIRKIMNNYMTIVN